jgi:hypothetical protein
MHNAFPYPTMPDVSFIYDGACSSFKMPSYMPNMMAALGTVRKR